MKEKLWTLSKADKEFSLYIRNRDKRCMNPRCKNPFRPVAELQNSHFWPRQEWIARFDIQNCIALCPGCHIFRWEQDKKGEYQDFMRGWLGEKKFNALKKKVMEARKLGKGVTKRQMIINVMEFLYDKAEVLW